MLLRQAQDPIKAIKSLQSENFELKKELTVLSKLKAQVLKEALSKKIKTIKEIQFLACEVDLDAQGMKDLAFEMGATLESAIIIFASQKTGKPLLSCYISKDLVANDGKNAVTIIKILGEYIQGGGGGQAFYATAGGKNLAGIQEAITAAENICIN